MCTSHIQYHKITRGQVISKIISGQVISNFCFVEPFVMTNILSTLTVPEIYVTGD